LKSLFQPVKVNTMAKTTLMLEGVLADKLGKNEMVPSWLKGRKTQSIKHTAAQFHFSLGLQKIRVSKNFKVSLRKQSFRPNNLDHSVLKQSCISRWSYFKEV